ncbi:kinesin-like protein KIN-14T [Punica granatum]|uniref:Kinesin-like protein KIN-14T n=2 Tax=Punica granatum TaxID=22663 RepID=A0A6P8CWY2_PUNGR|nr:kinesin-like protein KIN-14T [Punica granatum]XP_031388620.1 kinesin-like protein KIN-14T [Punica granatum]PKI71548.1 hypothetical protein CRG98_008065 [Punica granatum]
MKESSKSVANLTETIHSLLGMKATLTPNWVDSVCDIVKSIHSRGSNARFQPTKLDSDWRSLSTADEIDKDQVIISKLNDEIASLNSRINELSLRRRQALNEYLDLKGNIRVFCRMRPITMGENLGRSRPVAAPDSSKVFLEVAGSNSRSYSFDRVFPPGSSQDEVFMEVEPVIKSALDGYNACLFAYGQTGTGKTFTMEGNSDNPGLVPRTIQALLKRASNSNYKYLFRFSMLEIYLRNLKDLLVPQPVKPTDPMPPNLTIQMDPSGGIDIENLVAIPVSDHNQALQLYRLGCRFRSTASTNSNLNSSRSHCLIRISITCLNAPERRREKNKVWLIDLGGSERVVKTKASGRRLEEGKAINLSLSALGDVIYALQRKKGHIPFRNSKLTQVLKDSLGEDSKTLMLVHVSPKEEDLCETICTLNFAARVRSTCLGNEDPTEKAQKEAAKENLQAVIAGIECERQKLREDMDKLNIKLKSLTRTDPSCCENEYLALEVPQVNPDITKNKIKDARAASSSKLPGFMRPTFCSQKKSGTNQPMFDEKQLFKTRKRRTSSHRARSVAFPMKSGSEYTSDCSISGASCLVDLMKSTADVETEHSIDTSECDIKMVVFSEEKKLVTSDKMENKNYSMQHLKVDKWLQSRESRLAARISNNRRVPAVPLPLKQKGKEQNRAESLHCKVDAKDFKTTEIDKHYSKNEVVADEGASSSLTVEVEMDTAQSKQSNSLMNEDQMLDMESWFDASLILEDENYPFKVRDDILSGELEDFRQNEMPALQKSKEFIHEHNDPEEKFYVSDSSSKSELYLREVLYDMNMEDTEGSASPNMFKIQGRTNHLDLKNIRALFTDDTIQKNTSINTQNVHQLEGNAGKAGIYHPLNEKVQIICASALLGLRLQSLGFGDDFFNGLTR